MLILLFFAFVSGIITVLSPCILPVLPIVLTGSVGGGKARPFGIITGFIVSFTFFTLALTALVQSFKISPDILRVVAAVIVILFGLVMVIPWLKDRFQILFSSLANAGSGKPAATSSQAGSTVKVNAWSGFLSGILVGLSLGLVWTPCVGPIMASVIALALSQKVDNGAVFITLAYTAGTSLPMLAIMLGGRRLLQKVPALTKNSETIQKVFGVLMIVVGLAVWTGLDRQFQTLVLKVFPNYGAGLTAVENNKIVRNVLTSRYPINKINLLTNETALSNSIIFRGTQDQTEPDISLPDYGLAPDFIQGANWLNSPGLTMASLRGKVVMVDFWTYSCINCVRTLPYLQAWYKAYRDKGLVIVGIHTPEFEFEKKADNLKSAVKNLNVSWPVVQDNDYKMWNLYGNQYWPAHYFIDRLGHVRYFHFGEGNYAESEQVIQKLIRETGIIVKGKVSQPAQEIDAFTPETYLGYERANGFVSSPAQQPDRPIDYSPARQPNNGEWTLTGNWTIHSQYIEPVSNGILELEFNARNVFLVMNPMQQDATLTVLVDGMVSKDTTDIVKGKLTVGGNRLYQLVGLKSPGLHRLRLEIKGKIRLFAFTFG